MREELRNRIWFVVEIVIILFLLSLSIPFLIPLFKQFFSESSTFKTYKKPTEEFPTITFCTPSSTNNSYKIFEYGIDFNITYLYYMDDQWSMNYKILEKGQKNEMNSMNSTQEVYLEQILRLGYGNGDVVFKTNSLLLRLESETGCP